MEAMSKKEKLARGSAVIKVMRVSPRPGRYLKNFVDVHKMPKKVQPPPTGKRPPMALLEMPHLDLKSAVFNVDPMHAKINGPTLTLPSLSKADVYDPCAVEFSDDDIDSEENKRVLGLPDGHYMLTAFGYREWARTVYPTSNGNVAEHINILLGLLISMAIDPKNEHFPDVEAFPCIQFLSTIRTPEGEVPRNVASFIKYVECICMKIIEEA